VASVFVLWIVAGIAVLPPAYFTDQPDFSYRKTSLLVLVLVMLGLVTVETVQPGFA